MLQIIIQSEEDRAAVNRLNELLEMGLSKEVASNNKWLLTKQQVMDLCGWSESTIAKKIEKGLLTAIQDVPDSNSKVRFYINEVLSNIPNSLRKKYGEPG